MTMFVIAFLLLICGKERFDVRVNSQVIILNFGPIGLTREYTIDDSGEITSVMTIEKIFYCSAIIQRNKLVFKIFIRNLPGILSRSCSTCACLRLPPNVQR